MDFEIATFWNVEPLYYVFNAVSATIKNNDYAGLIKFCLYLGAFIGCIWWIQGRPSEFLRWFISALIFSTIVNLPVARVTIIDRTGYEGPRVVDNVPWTLALSASTFAHIRDWLTDTAETVLSLPDDLKFQKHDIGFGHRILKAANEVTVTDPELRADIMQFIKECTIYDIRDGVIQPASLLGSTDAWNTLFGNTNPARFVTTRLLSGGAITDTCTNVANGTGTVGSANGLKQRLQLDQQQVLNGLGRQFNPQITNAQVAGNLLAQQLGSTQDFLWASGGSAAQTIRQAMFNNVWREAGGNIAQMLQDPGAVSAMNAATMAAAQTNTTLRAQTIMAEETLPRFHNAIEFILIAIFPIILPLMVTQTADKARAVLMNYFSTMAWVALWPMLFAVLNFLMTINLARKAKWVSGTEGIPFAKLGPFQSMLVDDQAMIGYLVWLVPVIAGAIVKLGQGPMNNAFDRAFHTTQSAASAAGGQAALGNYQTGSQTHDSMSSNITQANKFNTDYATQNGAMSLRMGNGTTVTRYGQAVSTIAEAMNSLAVQDSSRIGQRIGSSVNANQSTSFDKESFASAGGRANASLQSYMGHEAGRSDNQNLSDAFRVSEGGGRDDRTGTGQRDASGAFQQDSYQQMDGTTLNAGVSGGLGVGGGGKGGGSGGGGGAGLGGSANLGLEASYSSNRNRNMGRSRDATSEESFNQDQFYRQDGSVDKNYNDGTQSHQSNVDGKRASLEQGQFHEKGQRASVRQGEGIDHRSQRENFKEHGFNFDQYRAVDLADKLQQTFGISPFRFAAMSADQKRELLQEYSAIQQTQQQWTLPEYLDGQLPKTNRQEVAQSGKANVDEVKDSTQSAYRDYAKHTGAKSTAPVSMPTEFSNKLDHRMETAKENIHVAKNRVAETHQKVKGTVDPNLDKDKSRTADVSIRAWDDMRDVLGYDSNDRSIAKDYEHAPITKSQTTNREKLAQAEPSATTFKDQARHVTSNYASRPDVEEFAKSSKPIAQTNSTLNTTIDPHSDDKKSTKAGLAEHEIGHTNKSANRNGANKRNAEESYKSQPVTVTAPKKGSK
ncbi:MAG: conjugal transfer protein TraG N-terminal domain-containing protein [Ottowia sp.]|nr:conjugal transfer protein TraG N-terminal domain-containing protein [Ottowia sp.]